MDYLQKPPIKKTPAILKGIVCTVLVFLIFNFIIVSVTEAMRYRAVVANPLTLQAYITHVETIYDSENSDDYDAMMKYSYGGITYVDAYKRFGREEDARKLVGKTVTIQVDPNSPGETLEEVKHSGENFILYASILLGLTMFMQRIHHRETYVHTYGWRREAVKKDMVRELLTVNWFSFLLPPVLLHYAVAICFADVYFEFSFGDVLALVLGIGSLAGLVKCISRLKLIHQDQFRLSRDVFVSKRIDKDSDDYDVYYVTYQNNAGTWEKKVKWKVYGAAGEGDVIESAYIVGESKPVLSYSPRTGSF